MAVGSVKKNTLKVPIKKIKNLNLPIGIFHHIKDVCDNSFYITAKKLQKKIKRNDFRSYRIYIYLFRKLKEGY